MNSSAGGILKRTLCHTKYSKGERGRTRHTVQTISKRQALYSGKVPMNAELRHLRREKRGTVIRHFERGDEDVTSILHRTATQLLLPPHIGYYSITLLMHMAM